MPIEWEETKLGWRKDLFWKERGPVAKVLCLLGKHAWRHNVGYTDEEFLTCNRCMKNRDYIDGKDDWRWRE